MKPIREIPEHYHMYKTAKHLSSLDPERFQFENFYLFGWNGRLSFDARKNAAEDLYAALVSLTKEYQEKYNITPRFRIITHSHGGNVALNLVAVKGDEDIPVIISELILLACPVQERTKGYCSDPFFKRVYSFFSRGELLQVIDPQGFYKGNNRYPFFSQRVFPNNPKLSQAAIKIHGRSILHLEFILNHFVSKLPAMLNALDKELVCQKNDREEDDYAIIDLRKKATKKKKGKAHKTVII